MDLTLENTAAYPLAPDLIERLLAAQHECTMTWATREQWPMAAVQLFLWHGERIWTTTSGHKKRALALGRRPRSCIVVSGMGTELGGDRSVTIKTRVTIHDDRATKDWFLPALAAKVHPDDAAMSQIVADLLDSPRRLVLEHEPVTSFSYDGIAMRDALAAQILGATED